MRGERRWEGLGRRRWARRTRCARGRAGWGEGLDKEKGWAMRWAGRRNGLGDKIGRTRGRAGRQDGLEDEMVRDGERDPKKEEHGFAVGSNCDGRDNCDIAGVGLEID